VASTKPTHESLWSRGECDRLSQLTLPSAIFQESHLQGLLGFHSNGADVVTWLQPFLFTVLFGPAWCVFRRPAGLLAGCATSIGSADDG